MRNTASVAPSHPGILWSIVLTGILSISFASIFIRLADAPPSAIAAYRVTLAALAIFPYYYHKRKSTARKREKNTLLLTVLSGLFLAMHFAFWIRSLQMTSVASAVTLVSTTPIFVALLTLKILRERHSRRVWFGIATATFGAAFVSGVDFSLSGQALAGDLLAILGAVAAAGYLLTGRAARRSLDTSSYIFETYGAAAVALLALCFVTSTPLTGFSDSTYLFLILLALVPQLIGHTAFNWALRFLSPTSVSALILGEPIGAALLAFIFLGETVTVAQALGLLVLGAGILLAAPAAGNGRIMGKSP